MFITGERYLLSSRSSWRRSAASLEVPEVLLYTISTKPRESTVYEELVCWLPIIYNQLHISGITPPKYTSMLSNTPN